ncbi:Flp1 family type IVb pilin [Paenibacillus sp. MBLB4367]|uniref:Flp1 family type IVb pilin n=1 Tax=Paenibacillus sp. MBLB4367 TaxID=3384767 RepID=UPI00390809DC
MGKQWSGRAAAFWKDEEGLGTLEVLLILAVIVIIAVAFRKWIMKWVGDLFNKADTEINNQNLDGSSISPTAKP